MDPTIDAMVEKSETTTDSDELEKLVKQIQLEALKRYTPYYNILSPDYRKIFLSSLQDYDVNPIPLPKLQQKAWFKNT
jgi:hypothetical protein